MTDEEIITRNNFNMFMHNTGESKALLFFPFFFQPQRTDSKLGISSEPALEPLLLKNSLDNKLKKHCSALISQMKQWSCRVRKC